ncbi:Cupin domain-containing protein [Sulfidibacter corallicola]|uniref:Cupin domain-containing protein n=1 Tax=Sulfidibacter corallicola TaxID=2818388 RepID=A0A8A4TQ31_SULCO|nr:cupin domain-containing protein [Sulfidibacter corallicola]QTD51653.1 cupin domain-containing protein [Sulfidibacter corallicola]
MSKPDFKDDPIQEVMERRTEHPDASSFPPRHPELETLMHHIGHMVEDVAPPPELKDRLRARIAKRKAGAQAKAAPSEERLAPGITCLRTNDMDWQATSFAGITIKVLHLDREKRQVTKLVRMEPGASYPGHLHAGLETFLVLEGDICGETISLKAGDYCRAEATSVHEHQWTQHGCMLLLTGSFDDEIIEDKETEGAGV